MAPERKTHTHPNPGESALAWLLRHERDRDGHRFTRDEVAEAAGISRSAVQSYEEGRTEPQLSIAMLLANKLEITERSLLLVVTPPSINPPQGHDPSSKLLREHRESRSFTWRQMAEYLRINPSLLRAYEEGLAVPFSIIQDVMNAPYVPPGRRREGAGGPQGVPTDEPIPASETTAERVGHLRERIYEIDAPSEESPAQDGDSDPRGE